MCGRHRYASYGWWLHKSADGKTFTASAFVDEGRSHGLPSASTACVERRRTWAALPASTLSAVRPAERTTPATSPRGRRSRPISMQSTYRSRAPSTQFMGADGQSRDWSVELMDSSDHQRRRGRIVGDGDENGNGDEVDHRRDGRCRLRPVVRVSPGQRRRRCSEGRDRNVPPTYGHGNSMVGAFGANKQ